LRRFARQDVHVGSEIPLGSSSGSSPALQLFSGLVYNGVHRNSLAKFGIFFWYYLSSTEYHAEKHIRRKALAAYLPLAHSYGYQDVLCLNLKSYTIKIR